ncbi:kinesin [Novymonas esmeraldas]|uniref:Kinesin n=1 Tax=Novymonas esmeraldas TaxID=1808958 RepID=A0AAW0F552_9TRYP
MEAQTHTPDSAPDVAATSPLVVWKYPTRTASPSRPAPSTVNQSPAVAVAASAVVDKSYFGRIRVVVRCRPLQPETEADHATERVHVDGDEVIVCDKLKPNEARSYRFDRVLPPTADQVTTFAEVAPLVEHALDGFHATVFAYGQTGSGKTYTMDGMRYATPAAAAAGRTQRRAVVPDVDGTAVQQHGIMPRVIQLLFDRARERQGRSGGGAVDEAEEEAAAAAEDGVEYRFRCSFYQIYNERITDLLRSTDGGGGGDGAATNASEAAAGPSSSALTRLKVEARSKKGVDEGSLRVRWHKGDVFKVENLFICSCGSPDEMRAMLFAGIQNKVVSSHLMNHQSSRSHCVFTIYVESRERRSGELRSRAELSLVDLAGSEKIALLSHNPSAKLVKESIDINTSLLALGKVITALSSGAMAAAAALKKKHLGLPSGARGGAGPAAGLGHIPYRDSKLTMLLKHALGGNSLTTMIACISPSDRYVEETTSTLLYAGRAKNIRNAPHVNEDATTLLIRQLRDEIAQLKAELGYYRDMAAKSLIDREGRPPRLFPRGGDGGDGSAVRATGEAGLPAAAMTAVAEHEVDQLADSLVAACGMLANMMQLNAQLRDSYDTVRDVQQAAERREEELNAENLALRERLAVLEAIVLEDGDSSPSEGEDSEGTGDTKGAGGDDDDGDDGNDGGGVRDAVEPPRSSSASQRRRQERLRVLAGALATPQQQPPQSKAADSEASAIASVGQDDDGGGRRAAGGAASSHPSASPPRTTGGTRRDEREVHWDVSATPTQPPLAPTPQASVSRASTRAPPVRTIALSASTVVEQLPVVLRGVGRGSPSFGGATAAPGKHRHDRASSRRRRTGDETEEQRRRRHRKLAHKKPTKRHGALARQLREYETRYRTPQAVETYADYYQQPPRSQSTAVVVPRVPAIRASEAAAPQVTAALQEMKATVAKLPPAVVPEYVPASLLRPGLFGSLAFGGGDAEKAPFEQNRNTREARLRALQLRQQELYLRVHHAVHGRSSEDLTDGDLDPSASPAASATGNGGASYPSTAMTPSYSTATAERTDTAVHRTTGAARARPASSTDNMARLMEYLNRDT